MATLIVWFVPALTFGAPFAANVVLGSSLDDSRRVNISTLKDTRRIRRMKKPLFYVRLMVQ